MKQNLIILLLLTSIFAIGQEKLTVGNDTEINDSNGKLFRYYGHGAKLDLVKMYDDYAEVEIDCKVYKVESKYYKNIPKITIRIGMSISDLVSILGSADDTISSQTQHAIYWTYIYGKTYYHFENSKLTAINSY